MIGIVAALKIKEGCKAQFETGFKELAAKVKANESGNLLFLLTKSRTEPNTYKVLELYADEAAQKHHGQTDYIKAARAGVFADTLDGRSEVEFVDAVD